MSGCAACVPATAKCAADAGDAGAPSYLNGGVTFSSNGYAQLRSVVVTPSAPFKFRFAFQLRISGAGTGPGPVVFASARSDVNELFPLLLEADATGTFKLCQGAAPCTVVGAFVPNTWHQIEWTGDLTDVAPGGMTRVSVDCGLAVERAMVKAIYETAGALYFGAGVTSVGNGRRGDRSRAPNPPGRRSSTLTRLRLW